MVKYIYYSCIIWLMILSATGLQAQIILPKIFNDHMVLQQGKKVPVWGTAAPGAAITVRFQEQVKPAIADEQGRWSVQLDELTASKKPNQLVVQSLKDKVTFRDVLIGEVWLVSGQSNMEYSMHNHPQYAKPKKGDPDFLEKAFKAANDPLIRVLYVEKHLKSDVLPTNGWQKVSPAALAPVSAIGYFYAKALVDSLDVPVGIISSSWGGTSIETWTPSEAYAASSVFGSQLEGEQLHGETVGIRYNKMIAPIAPYSLRGFLWYQGETNLIRGDIGNYADKKKVLIEAWRKSWEDDTLPFYYVQLAPYSYSQRRNDAVVNTWEALPKFWEVQYDCLAIPYTGMVSTTDLVDDVKDIHPSYKWIIAERLARLALAKDYGYEGLPYNGPTFKKMTVADDHILLTFDHAAEGLFTPNGEDPTWFVIKHKSGNYQKAKARIEGNTVVIQREKHHLPVVRFAWDELAMPNLYNKAGLPALPFRTDK